MESLYFSFSVQYIKGMQERVQGFSPVFDFKKFQVGVIEKIMVKMLKAFKIQSFFLKWPERGECQ